MTCEEAAKKKSENYKDWYRRTKQERKEKFKRNNMMGYEARLTPEFMACEDCRTCLKFGCRHNHAKQD